MYQGGNFAHWMIEPLGPTAVRKLRRYADGEIHLAPPGTADFDIAYLLARHCLTFNKKTDVLQITDKGKDALDWYAEEKPNVRD